MKKILTGGCSFSAISNRWNNWPNILAENFSNEILVINRAGSSFGQGKIVESIVEELIKQKFDIDYVIVQWSAIGRGYADTELAFTKRIIEDDEIYFAPYMHEYIRGKDTTVLNKISLHFYKSSLTQILLLKTLLNYHKIPYKMFWGWEQISNDMEEDLKDILDLIYDENFIRFQKHGGMSEIIRQNLGKKGFIPEDPHPSNEGHYFFYNEVIKNIVLTEVFTTNSKEN